MNLDKGTFAYVVVAREWYDQMANAEILQPLNENSNQTVKFIARIVGTSDVHGLWLIEVEGSELEFLVPWHFVISIATSPAMRDKDFIERRRAPGFAAKE